MTSALQRTVSGAHHFDVGVAADSDGAVSALLGRVHQRDEARKYQPFGGVVLNRLARLLVLARRRLVHARIAQRLARRGELAVGKGEHALPTEGKALVCALEVQLEVVIDGALAAAVRQAVIDGLAYRY